ALPISFLKRFAGKGEGIRSSCRRKTAPLCVSTVGGKEASSFLKPPHFSAWDTYACQIDLSRFHLRASLSPHPGGREVAAPFGPSGGGPVGGRLDGAVRRADSRRSPGRYRLRDLSAAVRDDDGYLLCDAVRPARPPRASPGR